MKRLAWLVLAVVLVASGAAWAQFYEQLDRGERRELAEAYFLVGRQYAAQGEQAKARDFQLMAYHLDPELDPASIRLEAEPSAAELIMAGKAELVAVPRETAGEVGLLLKSRFLRLVSAFLTEDTDTILSILDGSVWFNRFEGELSQEAIRSDLEAFFARVDLGGGLVPSQVYDLSTLEVEPVAGSAWGDTYALRLEARADFSEQAAFWEPSQEYWFHRRGRSWRLFSVGLGSPPAAWAPQAAPVAQAPAAAEPAPGSAPKAIREAFLASLRHFLAKETAQAAEYFTREIRILRLNATLTREEMAATFEGYFEGNDFSGVGEDSVVDTATIAVEPTDRFAGEQGGEIYLLSVKTRVDLSDRIPFWTRFQEYYFSPAEGDWKIFAIF